jgi:hypothetical protein
VESFGAFNGIRDEWGECVTGKPGGPPGHQINCTGDWDVLRTRTTIYAARNATALDKKTVCFHAFPGPAGTPLGGVNGTATTHPSPPHNSMAGNILSTGWYGTQKAPWQWMTAEDGYTPLDVVNATKQATADMLVQSLAPFLIMAEETSFFGYGWFYDMESGYAPCDDNRTLCLAPDGWFPGESDARDWTLCLVIGRVLTTVLVPQSFRSRSVRRKAPPSSRAMSGRGSSPTRRSTSTSPTARPRASTGARPAAHNATRPSVSRPTIIQRPTSRAQRLGPRSATAGTDSPRTPSRAT